MTQTTSTAPHGCGICDGPLVQNPDTYGTTRIGQYPSFTCTTCGAWYTSKNCCAVR